MLPYCSWPHSSSADRGTHTTHSADTDHTQRTDAGELGGVCNAGRKLPGCWQQTSRTESTRLSTSAASWAGLPARGNWSGSAADSCHTQPGLVRRQSKLGRPQKPVAACLERMSQTRQDFCDSYKPAGPQAGSGRSSAAEALSWQPSDMHSAVKVLGKQVPARVRCPPSLLSIPHSSRLGPCGLPTSEAPLCSPTWVVF